MMLVVCIDCTIQYTTVQYSTAQHSTAQYSTVQDCNSTIQTLVYIYPWLVTVINCRMGACCPRVTYDIILSVSMQQPLDITHRTSSHHSTFSLPSLPLHYSNLPTTGVGAR